MSAALAAFSAIGARRRHRRSEMVRFGAFQTSLDVRAADATPPVGGTFHFEISVITEHGHAGGNLPAEA